MSLSLKRENARILLLAGASIFAICAAAQAQDTVQNDETTGLGVIHLIADGRDNVEATGGTEIDAQDLERLKPANLSELFVREASVAVSGGGGAAKKVTVLGVEQSLLATTVDGVPQGATAWHHTGSSVVDPVFLKAVKIEAGAAAADSGFGAAAGSLRYETVGADDLLEPGQTIGGRVGLSYGTNGRGTAVNLAGFGRHQALDWFIMVNGADGKDYKDGNGMISPGTGAAGRNGLAKFGYEAEGHRIELAYERSRDDADRLIKANLGQSDTNLYPLKVSRDTLKLSYTSTNPTAAWDPELTFYLSDFQYWRPNYATRNNGDAIFNEEQFGGKAQNTFDLGVGRITAGLDFNQHDYHVHSYGDGTSVNMPDRYFSSQQIGLFAQGRFEFSNGLNLSTGLRYDTNRFTDWQGKRFSDSGASVNATLAYTVNDNFEVFAGASDTWMGYPIGDYGYVHARAADYATVENLQTADAKNYKLGANFGGQAWQGGVTLFDTKLKNLFEYGSIQLENNADEFRSKGITLNARYDFGDTQIGASFTKADVTADGVLLAPSNGVYLAPVGKQATLYVDHHVASLEATFGLSAKWAGDVEASSTDRHFYAPLDRYTFVNAYGEWKPAQHEGLTLRLGVDNLFDKQYSERSGFGTAGVHGRDVSLTPVYAPGRTLTIDASLKF